MAFPLSGHPTAALILCLAAAAAHADDASVLAVTPCTPEDFSSVPITADIDFATQIQPIFNARCTSCHGGAGGLSLAPANAFNNLVNVPSSNISAQIARVTPFNPEASFLFKKVNCTNLNGVSGTPFGLRMPRNAAALSLAQQALIFDWIAAGAALTPPPPDPALIFRSGFENPR